MINLQKQVKKVIRYFLEKIGLIPITRYDALKKDYTDLLIKDDEKYTSLLQAVEKKNAGIIMSIVFSKDRAMQLHAFLRSYMEKTQHRGTMTVLYATSNKEHEQSYNDLAKIFKNDDIVFCKEHNFRPQLLEIIRESQAGKIMFFVDDMIFTHNFDFDSIRHIDTRKYIVSLTRGRDLTYSVVLQKDLRLPHFYKQGEIICFNWNEIKEYSCWTYPLGVSGYMYGMTETLLMLEKLSFKAPNSLESSMQEKINLFIDRYGLCTDEAVAVCVHANIVQTEGENPILNTFSVGELLELWNDGKQIDLSFFYGQPCLIAQEIKYSFQNREN
jgi:hypothetical protein